MGNLLKRQARESKYAMCLKKKDTQTGVEMFKGRSANLQLAQKTDWSEPVTESHMEQWLHAQLQRAAPLSVYL